jgi:hypothetical protein
MKLTKRGERVLGFAFVAGLLVMLGFAGYIETQDTPTCSDYVSSQNWQAAWENNCPFKDEQGSYLYTWTP